MIKKYRPIKQEHIEGFQYQYPLTEEQRDIIGKDRIKSESPECSRNLARALINLDGNCVLEFLIPGEWLVKYPDGLLEIFGEDEFEKIYQEIPEPEIVLQQNLPLTVRGEITNRTTR